MKKLTIILVVLALGSSVNAALSKSGTAGAQFLEIGVGSRYQGMGEASVAVVSDVYSMYWNPAGLAAIEDSEVSFTNVNWFLDIDLNYIAFARRFEGVGVFGVSATVLSMDKQESTSFDFQDGTGDFYTASSFAIGLSYARQLTAKFAFGGSVKYVAEKIDFVDSRGVAFDFGTMLHTGFRSLRLGMSISNMGTDLTFHGTNLEIVFDPLEGQGANDQVSAELSASSYSMPLAFRVGAAYDWSFGESATMTVAGEMKHPNDHEQQGALGAELNYDDKYFVRGGYKLNYDEETLAFGGGLALPVTGRTTLMIDYSWQDFGRLQSAQRFSIGFRF